MHAIAQPNKETKSVSNLMKCLVKEDLNVDGLVLHSDKPSPKANLDEVVIRVLATSVCGTDKNIYNIKSSEGMRREMNRYVTKDQPYKPIIVGHEFCGIVESVGERSGEEGNIFVPAHLRVEPGDYVTAEMHLSCGHCKLCRTGNEHICTSVKVKGVHLDGCFAQRVSVPYKNVILLGKGGVTEKLPAHIGAMLDAFGNAVHTVWEADVRGKSVAILGAGPLGLMATFLCRDLGASRIYLSEAADVDRRFQLGTTFGANLCIDVSKGPDPLYKAVETHELSANGVDVVLEMSGSPQAYNDAFRIVRNGGSVLLLGLTRNPLNDFDIANGVIWKGVTVKGIFGRRMFETWETMLRLFDTERFSVKENLELLSCKKQYTLEEYKEAFELLSTGKEMKLVFTPNNN